MPNCKICKRKILKWNIDIHTCKCGNLYCGKHIHDHSCTFNYLEEHKKEIRKNLPIIESTKGLLKI